MLAVSGHIAALPGFSLQSDLTACVAIINVRALGLTAQAGERV